MKILVTGGAGFIGSVTVKMLKNSGHEVFVYDNLSKGHKKSIPEVVIFIEGDISDKEKLKKVLKDYEIEAVIHFAAYIEAGESVYRPSKYFKNNVINSLILLEAMNDAGVKKIVFSSSAAVYGNPKKIPIEEDSELSPTSPYGETKLLVEELLMEFVNKYGFFAVALRYFNAAGALEDSGEDHFPETHIIPNFIKAALEERDIFIFGDGSHGRDYIHVNDLARAHLLAVLWLVKEQSSRKNGFFEPFNLGTGKMHSNIEVTEKIIDLVSKKLEKVNKSRMVFLDSRPGDPQDLLASSEKAKKYLNWHHEKTNIEQIILDSLNWHINYPRGFESGEKILVEKSILENLMEILFVLDNSDIEVNVKIKILNLLLKNEENAFNVIKLKKEKDNDMLKLLKEYSENNEEIYNIIRNKLYELQSINSSSETKI